MIKEKIYVKDKVDGQQHCISGDEHFYLIEVTDIYSKNVEVGVDGMLEWLRNTRREFIKLLDDAFKKGVLTQKEREVLYWRNIDWIMLEDCGKKLSVTRERIRQIEAKALEKLRCYEKN